jgi:hypothetical protein
VELFQDNKFELVFTRQLEDFMCQSDILTEWVGVRDYARLKTIVDVLGQLALQQRGVHRIQVSQIEGAIPHPLPLGCDALILGAIWSDEVGRLLVLHSRHAMAGRFFIGIASGSAFAGGALGGYDNASAVPTFPLVGPDQLSNLDDAFIWDLPNDIHQRNVTFDQARHNIGILGGIVKPPRSGTSHYQVQFATGRTWPLDSNFDVLPERYLDELVPITRCSLNVIRYVLTLGDWPLKRLRIPPN